MMDIYIYIYLCKEEFYLKENKLQNHTSSYKHFSMSVFENYP